MKNIILPSSESNFFDTKQYHSQNNGSGINVVYPSPANLVSSIYGTYPSDANVEEKDGVFEYNELDSIISSASGYNLSNNFNSFNSYIHYYPRTVDDLDDITENNKGVNRPLRIPYVSSFRVSSYIFNPYAPRF